MEGWIRKNVLFFGIPPVTETMVKQIIEIYISAKIGN
jgi:hypothetical protein